MSANDPSDVDVVRRFTHLIATTPLDGEEWREVRAVLGRLLETHGEHRLESPYAAGFRDGSDLADVDRNARHPIATGTTAVFPQLALEVDGHTVIARLRFGPAHEGPPGLVHGGFVSAAFDMVVSAAASQIAPLNVTRWLKVRFLRPSFLGDDLTFSASAQAVEGRLIEVAARLTNPDGRLIGRAEAQCASLPVHRFADRSAAAPAAGDGEAPA